MKLRWEETFVSFAIGRDLFVFIVVGISLVSWQCQMVTRYDTSTRGISLVMSFDKDFTRDTILREEYLGVPE
jgi:hypothetical protein